MIFETPHCTILSDIHGRIDHINTIAIPDVQIGDLANCVYHGENQDNACLEWALEHRVVVCVGNHEYPHINPECSFSGFYRHATTAILLNRLEREGLLVPAVLHPASNTLITHAGVTYIDVDARTVYECIMQDWCTNQRSALFSDVGQSRGGRAHNGGIFWSDWSENKLTPYFNQVVGHTIGDEIRQYKYTSNGDTGITCIDVPPGELFTIGG